MKRILVTFVAALALLSLSGLLWVFEYRRGTVAARPSAAVQKIRIANVGQGSIFNIIAKEKGYFADSGLEAEVTEYDSGATSVAALRAGDADVAVAANFVGVATIFSDKSLRVLAELSKQDVFQIVARKDRGIAFPSNLKGKKVGVTLNTAGELYLGRFLEANGLQRTDVEMVDLSPAQMAEQLQQGQIDAMLTFDPHAYRVVRKMGDAVVEWAAQGTQSSYALAYSTKPFIEAHPDVVERYFRALKKAEAYVREQPGETKRLIGDRLEYDPDYVDYLWLHFTFEIKLSEDMLVALEEQARWMIQKNMTDQAVVPNYLSHIYFPALETVDPAAITIIH